MDGCCWRDGCMHDGCSMLHACIRCAWAGLIREHVLDMSHVSRVSHEYLRVQSCSTMQSCRDRRVNVRSECVAVLSLVIAGSGL